jgi:hypothetical protein
MISAGDEEPVRLPVTFPTELYEWLRETAHRRHVSMAHVVREALTSYRDQVDPQLRLPLSEGMGRLNVEPSNRVRARRR